MVDLVIKNGMVVTPQGMIRGGLAVQEGHILQVGSDASLPEAKEVVDAHGLIVFPGLVDPHTHIGLGLAQDEAKFRSDITTESASAAVGGVTTIVTTLGMASNPETLKTVIPTLRLCKEIGLKESLIDFKFTVAPFTDALIAEIPQLFAEGVTSFKFPLVYIGPEGKHFGITWFDWGLVYRGFEKIAQIGPPAMPMIHAEESAIIEVLTERLKNADRTDLRAWSEARPNICETMHVFACGLIAMEVGSPLYVVHTSAKESVDAIHYLMSKGVRVYGETVIHYLAPITKDADIGVIGKVNPPLREMADSERLWRGLAEGTLLAVGSDHCIYNRKDKEEKGIWDATPGFSGTGAILPIMMSQGVHKGRITLEQMAKVCAENPARLFSIYPKKGVLTPGADADIVLIDPDKEWTLGVESLKQGSDFSVWEGWKVKGKAMKTFVRGKLVAENGEPVIKPPHGVFVDKV